MKTSKRLLSLILALVMALTAFSVGFVAFAQEVNPKDNELFSAADASKEGSVDALTKLVDEFLPELLTLIDGDAGTITNSGIDISKIQNAAPVDGARSARFYELMKQLAPILLNTLGGIPKTSREAVFADLGLDKFDEATARALYSYLDDEKAEFDFWTLFSYCYKAADANGNDLEKLCAKYKGELTDLFNAANGFNSADEIKAMNTLLSNFAFSRGEDKIISTLKLTLDSSRDIDVIRAAISKNGLDEKSLNKKYEKLYAYLEYLVSFARGTETEIKNLDTAIFYMLDYSGKNNNAIDPKQSVILAGLYNRLAIDGGADFSAIGLDSLSYDNWYTEMGKYLGNANATATERAQAYIKIFDPDANGQLFDSPFHKEIEAGLKKDFGYDTLKDFETNENFQTGFFNNRAVAPAYVYQKFNCSESVYDSSKYPMNLSENSMYAVNATINGYVSMIENINVPGLGLDASSINGLLDRFTRVEGEGGKKLSLDYLANSVLKNIYIKLANDPVSTIANLLPLLTVLLDEVIIPFVFNQSGDALAQFDANGNEQGMTLKLLVSALKSLIGGDIADTIDSFGINNYGFDLNTSLPAVLDYIMGVDNNEHYKDLTVVVGTDEKGNDIVRAVPVIFNIVALDKLVAQYLYNYSFMDMLGGAIGDDSITAILVDVVGKIIPTLKKAVDTYLDGHRNDAVLTKNGDVMGRGLNNIPVALPTLIEILGQTILADLGIKDADWHFGNRITYTPNSTARVVTGTTKDPDTGKMVPVYEYFECTAVSNATVEQLKQFMFDKDQDASNVTGWIIDFAVSDILNSVIDFANLVLSSDNTITTNIPIITGLLNTLGGFTDLSVITDVLNGFFGLTRESKYSFTFAERDIPCSTDANIKYVGLSQESAYFLIANVSTVIRAIIDMVNAPQTVSAQALAPYAESKGTTTFQNGELVIGLPDFTEVLTEENIKAADELIETIDSLVSALLENTFVDGFSLDQLDGILSGVVTAVSNIIGKTATEDLLGLVQKYLVVINAENTDETDSWNGSADGKVNAKKVYSEKNLSVLVTETYALIENIVSSLLGDVISGDLGTMAVNAVNGIVSPGAVVSHSDYIDKAVLGYFSWNDVSNSKYAKNLGYTFDAGDKEAFFENLYDSLGAISSIFGALFCTTGFYGNVFAPIFNSINDKCGLNLIAATATNGEEVLLEFTKSISGYVNMLLKQPVTVLMSTISGLANVFTDAKLKKLISGVTVPLCNELKGVAAVLNLISPKLGNLITEDATIKYILNIDGLIATLIPDILNKALNTLLLPLLTDTIGFSITLPYFDWKALAASSPAEVLLKVYALAVETILSNDIFKLILGDDYDSVTDILNNIGKFDAVSILGAIRSILVITNSPTEAFWTFDHYLGKAKSNFTYPTGITASDASNAVGALDDLVANVFPLLQQFGVLDQGSLSELLSGMLFTNGTLTTIAKALYGAIDGALGETLASAGIEISSPAAVGAMLTDSNYSNSYKEAAKVLAKAKAWDDVKDLNWGFTDGSAKAQQGFINGLAAMLRPVQPVLAVLLGKGSISTKDLSSVISQIDLNITVADGVTLSIKNGVLTITAFVEVTDTSEPNTISVDLATILASMKELAIYGANGYESAIVPLLEALMCDGVKTFDQYVADYEKDLDNVLIDILNPIFGFVNKLAAAPVDTLTAVLPNLAYFIDNNGVAQLLDNLLAPLTQTILPELKKNGFDVDKIIINFLENDLGGLLTDLVGLNVDLDVTILNLKACSIQDILVPLINKLLADNGIAIALPDFKWSTIASHGEEKTVPSAARNSDGDFTTVRIIANQGETLVAVLRYVETLLVNNTTAIEKLLSGLLEDADPTVKNIVSSVLNHIKVANKDDIVKAVFYLLMQENKNAFFDYSGFKYKDYDFTYPETIDMEFLNVLAPMIDGILTGVLDQFMPGGLQGLVVDNLYKDNIISSLVTGLYGAVEGVKIDDNTNLAQLLAMTGIDFTINGVASVLTDKAYGQSYDNIAKVLKDAGSWSKVNAEKLVWGVKDRDSFLHALTAALRPVFGVLDVLLNDGSLGLFNLVFIPGSDGYTSTIVPLMEAFGLYNIKTQYQYREDISKEYDAILLDILNPLIDKVEDILNAPIQMLADMLPNLALFFANDGLLQLIDNLLLPISALLKAIEPIVNVNELLPALGLDVKAELGKVGIKIDKFDLYDLKGTLEPVIGSANILGVVNSLLPSLGLNLELMPIDWYQLASHGTVVTNEPSQVATIGARVYVQSDRNEVLVAVLRYLINTINYKDNLTLIADMVSGLMGDGADPAIADVVTQVLGMLEGETDDVLSQLCDLLQTFA